MKMPGNQIITIEDLYNRYYGREAYQSNIVGQLIQKSDDPISTASTGIVNPQYGAVVDTLLNFESDAFALMAKKPYDSMGFRLETAAPAALVTGVGENAALPDTIEGTFSEEEIVPKYMMTRWDITKHVLDRSALSDGIPGMEAFFREKNMEYFVRGMNQKLLADTSAEAAGASGDRTAGTDDLNIESLDRLVSSDSEEDAFGGSHDAWFDAYLAWDRDSGTTYDSQVDHASGVDRNLTLDLVDDTIDSTWNKGARVKNQTYLTGMDTFLDWSQLIDDKYRIETANVQITMNGVQTAKGAEGTIRVATYDTVPIFRSQDVTTDGASRIYLIDKTSVFFKVLAPTTYMRTKLNPDALLTDALRELHGYLWVGELFNTSPARNGKIRDLA